MSFAGIFKLRDKRTNKACAVQSRRGRVNSSVFWGQLYFTQLGRLGSAVMFLHQGLCTLCLTRCRYFTYSVLFLQLNIQLTDLCHVPFKAITSLINEPLRML